MDISFNPLTLGAALVGLVIGISCHEAMHAYVGLRLGDTTAQDQGRVSFNPLRHIDPLTTILLPLITLYFFHMPILAARPVPFNPARVKFDEFGAALIALAGPATNFVLALIGAFLAHGFAQNDSLATIFTTFVIVNASLFIFNLIPLPPLDGSRVLYAFAPEPLQNFMAQLEHYGIFIIFALILLVPAFSAALVNVNQSITLFLLSL